MLRPPTRIWPLVGDSAAKSNFKSVLLPAPDGPVSQTNSPFSMRRVMSSSTGASPGYDFFT